MKLSLAYILPFAVQAAYGEPVQYFPGSSASWADGRLDVVINGDGVLYHKYHANPQAGWNPGFEILDFPTIDPESRPTAVSWSANRLDIFAVSNGGLFHKYWDGSQWNPEKGAEKLASGVNATLAVTSWTEGRLDIVGLGAKGDFVHKYWDGSSWQPEGQTTESLGTDGFGNESFISEPAAVSWGKDRLDIFGVLSNFTLVHKYWDGTAWKGWEQWADGFVSNPVATSWGPNRLDVWGLRLAGEGVGELVHQYWDGQKLAEVESLGGEFVAPPSIAHWGVNRIDIFGTSPDNTVVYKYWDGYQWNPSDVSEPWFQHGPSNKDVIAYTPLAATWSGNNVHALVLNGDKTLNWQFWEGSQWLPQVNDFYNLGTLPKTQSERIPNMRKSKLDQAFVVQDPERNLDL